MKKMIYLVLVCWLTAALSLQASASQSLEEQIAALPGVEEFMAMSPEEQVDAYNRTQYAYAAYMDLPTAEEKEALEGAEEKFDALFSHFNTMIMPIETGEETGKVSHNQFIWVVSAGMGLCLLWPVVRKKRT